MRGAGAEPLHRPVPRQRSAAALGVPPGALNDVAWEAAFRKRLTIKLSTPSDLRPFVRLAWRSIRQDRIDMSRLITHRFGFADVQRAFETYRDRRDGALKVMIDFK